MVALPTPVRVIPRSGHASIVPHGTDSRPQGSRCGFARGRQAVLGAMDSMIEPAEQASEELNCRADRVRSTLRAPRSWSSRVVTPPKTSSANTSGAAAEDPSAATHRFLATMPGYQGWQWAVVVAAHPGRRPRHDQRSRSRAGPTALLAPQWVPWQDRVQPGDLSPGDLLATPTDDPRLVPGYMAVRRRGARRARRRDRAGQAAGAEPVGPHRGGASAGTTATTARNRRWPAPREGVPRLWLLPAAGRFAGHAYSVCAPTRCRPTGTSSRANTAAARTRTLRSPPPSGRRCSTRSTTAFSTWRSRKASLPRRP